MKIKLTFEPDEPGSRPTDIRIATRGHSAPLVVDGSSENPSVDLQYQGGAIIITRDYRPEPGKGFGASGSALAQHD